MRISRPKFLIIIGLHLEEFSDDHTPPKASNVVLQLLAIFVGAILSINQTTNQASVETLEKVPGRINKDLTKPFIKEKQLNHLVKAFEKVQLYRQARLGEFRKALIALSVDVGSERRKTLSHLHSW